MRCVVMRILKIFVRNPFNRQVNLFFLFFRIKNLKLQRALYLFSTFSKETNELSLFSDDISGMVNKTHQKWSRLWKVPDITKIKGKQSRLKWNADIRAKTRKFVWNLRQFIATNLRQEYLSCAGGMYGPSNFDNYKIFLILYYNYSTVFDNFTYFPCYNLYRPFIGTICCVFTVASSFDIVFYIFINLSTSCRWIYLYMGLYTYTYTYMCLRSAYDKR